MDSKFSQEKESVNTAWKAPEVYHEEPSLQPVSKDYKAIYVKKDTPEIGQQEKLQQQQEQHPISGSNKHRNRLWLLIAIAAIILVSLAIGLGVGLGLHFRGNSSPTDTAPQQQPAVTVTVSPDSITSSSLGGSSPSTSTTATTSTTSTAAPVVTSGTIGITASDCKTRRNNRYMTNNNPTPFILDCGADYPRTQPVFSGNGTVSDLTHLLVYTFEDCMESCAFYNAQTSTTTQCLSISYLANLTASFADKGANCWLKTARGAQNFADALYLPDSAYVVGV